MVPTSDWSGVNKSHYRSISARPGARYQSILTLPGRACKDLIEFDRQGVLSSSTFIQAIEHDRSAAAMLHLTYLGRLKKKYPKFDLYEGELTSFRTNRSFDFLNIDLCLSLDERMLGWLGLVRYRPGADLTLNVSTPRRDPEVIRFHDCLSRTFFYPGPGKEFARDEIKRFPHLVDLPKDELRNILAVRAALNQYDFDVVPPQNSAGDTYVDHVIRMHFYRFRGFRPAARPRPHLTRLLAPALSQVERRPPLPRHETAKTGALDTALPLARLMLEAETGTPGQRSYVAKRLRLYLDAVRLRGGNPLLSERALRAWVTMYRQRQPA